MAGTKNAVSFLNPATLDSLPWDAQHAEQSLQKVFEHVSGDANSALNWYAEARKPKKRGGLIIRATAVVLVSVAGILPILDQIVQQVFVDPHDKPLYHINPLFATVFIGMAAALVGFDRYFGFSSGWMRYVSTSLAIRNALEAFEMDWLCARAALAGGAPTAAQIDAMLAKAKEFAARLNTLVSDETNAWVQEFQASLKMVDDAVKAADEKLQKQADAARPGALNITLANRSAVTGPWKVQVDDRPEETFTGSTAAIGNVPPGSRKVQVFAVIGTEKRHEQKIVSVSPGAIVNESFTV